MKKLLQITFFLISILSFSQNTAQIETFISKKDSTYAGPRLGTGSTKFVGNLRSKSAQNFSNLWNQLTPENESKWAQIGITADTLTWNWEPTTKLYNYAKANKMQFKFHTLIWGRQQPKWMSDLAPDVQLKYITYWIKEVGRRFPDIEMVDVVNEALSNHWPPDGRKQAANYIHALGGTGKTGYDWVIKSFELARKYMPNTKLILNEYSVINKDSNAIAYLKIIKVLKKRKLIDGIGIQAHNFELTSPPNSTLKKNLDRLAATGIPIYISELDLGNIKKEDIAKDTEQLELYKRVFPLLWEHPAVVGITFWGYVEGTMWIKNCHLVRKDGTWRPAMIWLEEYLRNNPQKIARRYR